MTYWLGILLENWFGVGMLVLVWAARELIREEKQISNPDRSFYRRNDSDLLTRDRGLTRGGHGK